jgi:hypothetical protein
MVTSIAMNLSQTRDPDKDKQEFNWEKTYSPICSSGTSTMWSFCTGLNHKPSKWQENINLQNLPVWSFVRDAYKSMHLKAIRCWHIHQS